MPSTPPERAEAEWAVLRGDIFVLLSRVRAGRYRPRRARDDEKTGRPGGPTAQLLCRAEQATIAAPQSSAAD
jgi:hypothetical protein